MMSPEQLDQLGKATGSAADTLFLTRMQEHDEGAADMAQGELANGSNPEVKVLAQSIITSQTAEIAQMRALVDRLGRSAAWPGGVDRNSWPTVCSVARRRAGGERPV